jgi:glycosyltransferase involved in cell wall biosynthesis
MHLTGLFYFMVPDEQIDAYYLPYTLHPRFYRTFSDNTNFDACRKASRATRIIFSGNFERSLYNNKVLKDNFGWTISRVDILDHVKSAYKDDPRILYAPTQKHFYDLLRQVESRSKFIIAEVKTDPEDWLKILSSGDFYLCLPGMGMPWSHNAFEAMAIGTIPIIQYNHLFNPALVHQENCLAYHDFDSFNTALELALNMKPEEVERMKANVIAYYDAYISTKQIIKRIQSFYASDEETLTIALPYLNEEI